MWDWLAKLPDKLFSLLPKSWQTGLAKSAVVLSIAVVLVAGFAVAVAAILIAFEVGILGRGIEFSWMKIPDRTIENCKIISPHVESIEAEVKNSQAEYAALASDVKDLRTLYVQTYVGDKTSAAINGIQPKIDDAQKELDTQRANLKDSMERLQSETDKLIAGCK